MRISLTTGVSGSSAAGCPGARLAIRAPASQHAGQTRRRTMTLKDAATAVRLNAYAPYSGFRVGAALRTPGGQVFAGCNVENVAYPEGTCAEAGAIAAMIAGGESRIAEIYVIADSPDPVPPCGGCRQKLAEFAGQDVVVTMATVAGFERTATVAELLPGAFGKGHMETT
ncbi:cytidine deaminase [Puniceibacterium confluentis]|nr:cytidine deaminase [Puniceibacterium confluentis]